MIQTFFFGGGLHLKAVSERERTVTSFKKNVKSGINAVSALTSNSYKNMRYSNKQTIQCDNFDFKVLKIGQSNRLCLKGPRELSIF